MAMKIEREEVGINNKGIEMRWLTVWFRDVRDQRIQKDFQDSHLDY